QPVTSPCPGQHLVEPGAHKRRIQIVEVRKVERGGRRHARVSVGMALVDGRREFSPALTSVPAGLFHIARNDQPGSASSHPPVPGQGRSRTDEEETVSTTEQTQPVT